MPCPQVRRCGSTMSRRPSPSRLKQNTASISAAPGKKRDPPLARDDEGCAPSATMMPHSGVGGRTPRPMKRQAGGVEDGVAHVERHLHHHDRHDVGQHVHRAGCAHSPLPDSRAASHEAGLAPHVGLGAGDARVEREVDDRGGEHDVAHRVAERRDDAHRQHEQREGHDGVGDARRRCGRSSRRRSRPPAPGEAADQEGPAPPTATAMPKSSRVATTTRLKMSRPSWSVPNQCAADGGFSAMRGVAGQRIVGHDRRAEQRRQHDQREQRRRRSR